MIDPEEHAEAVTPEEDEDDDTVSPADDDDDDGGSAVSFASSEAPAVDVVLSEDEYNEFESTVHEIIYDKLNENPLFYSEPGFHKLLSDDVCHLFHTEWTEANILKNNETLFGCIEQMVESFFDVYYPPRSITNSNVFSEINVDHITSIIETLTALPQPKQKTIEWYQYRHGLITASNIWKALSTESQRNSLIYEKCKPFNPFAAEKGNWHAGGSLQWGVLYEAVSIMVYEKMYGTKVNDFGCIQHPKYACIGASPDGINVDPTSNRYGRMIEVKNIVNREITTTPKEEYWIQMQVQMETCGLDECDFIETRFKEYNTAEDYHQDTAQEWKGIILCFIDREVPNSKPTYRYMPFDLNITTDKWIANTKEELKDTLILYTTTYWYLDQFSCILVQRNKLWFSAALPIILDTWDTIVRERESGYEHRAAKKRTNTTTCQISQDSTYVISNLKLSTNVCLVKLDHE